MHSCLLCRLLVELRTVLRLDKNPAVNSERQRPTNYKIKISWSSDDWLRLASAFSNCRDRCVWIGPSILRRVRRVDQSLPGIRLTALQRQTWKYLAMLGSGRFTRGDALPPLPPPRSGAISSSRFVALINTSAIWRLWSCLYRRSAEIGLPGAVPPTALYLTQQWEW